MGKIMLLLLSIYLAITGFFMQVGATFMYSYNLCRVRRGLDVCGASPTALIVVGLLMSILSVVFWLIYLSFAPTVASKVNLTISDPNITGTESEPLYALGNIFYAMLGVAFGISGFIVMIGGAIKAVR